MKNSASGPMNTVSPTPVDRTYSTERLATPRGSRSYSSPDTGSRTSHSMTSALRAKNGSTKAVSGSGTSSMSDSSIDWKPATDDPSKPRPSSNTSSVSILIGSEKWCWVPGTSTKRTSKNSAPSSLAMLRTSAGVRATGSPLV